MRFWTTAKRGSFYKTEERGKMKIEKMETEKKYVLMLENSFVAHVGYKKDCQQIEKEIANIRKIRQRRSGLVPGVRNWLKEKREQMFVAEIERRHGETVIETDRYLEPIKIEDQKGKLTLMHVGGYRQYSRALGARYATLSYLCGVDDNGPWAVRVPGTLTTVSEALSWITPAKVRKAQQAGVPICRQGDVYIVACEQGQRHDVSELPGSHSLEKCTEGWILKHDSRDGRNHLPILIPFDKIKIFRQHALTMGRIHGAMSAAAD